MNYRLLGKSGLRVSELCLGTMTFGEDWGWGASKEDSHRIFGAEVDSLAMRPEWLRLTSTQSAAHD